jgi:hypothetical protein
LDDSGKGWELELTTLYVFGYESGTMPVSDSDKLFVAATVASLKEPTLIAGSDNDEKMVEIFSNLNILPFAAIVKPFPGYGAALKAKRDKIHVMARATRLFAGANVTHLDERTLAQGFDLRNTVWGFAMVQAIAQAVLNTLFSSSIDAIHVILDRKTMLPSMRQFFNELITKRIAVGTRQILKSLLPLDPPAVSEWENRVKFSFQTTSVSWSDDSEELGQQFGLRLADRFARKVYQARITGQPSIEAILEAAGFEGTVCDISELVTRLDQRLAEDFKKTTGLPEPKEL